MAPAKILSTLKHKIITPDKSTRFHHLRSVKAAASLQISKSNNQSPIDNKDTNLPSTPSTHDPPSSITGITSKLQSSLIQTPSKKKAKKRRNSTTITKEATSPTTNR